MSITVKNISKLFGSFKALDDVSVEAPGGQLVALLGPSGSGKTTLLRIIAGLEYADAGQVLFDGEDATERHARQRNVGFVFQHYALFRHMTIFENVAFSLRVRKTPRDEVQHRVMELLKLVQLENTAQRYPSQLSGGQRQRIALARALASRPRVLLLDEPFGALDAKVRKELRRWLRKLHEEIHVTSLFVTHDQEEALEVADRIVIMNKGRIEQVGTPDEVYHSPANSFVLSFLGHVNVFHGRLEGGVATLAGGQQVALSNHPGGDGQITALARPHEIDIATDDSHGGAAAKVTWVHRAGALVKVEVELEDGGTLLVIELSPERYASTPVVAGQRIFATPRAARVYGAEYQI